MKEQSKKLELFKSSILQESDSDVDAISEAMAAQKAARLREADARCSAEAERYRAASISAIRAAENSRVAALGAQNRRELLELREECAREVFGMARERIAAFTASADYAPHLSGLLNRAVAVLGYGFAADVYLRREDMPLSGYLYEHSSGVSLAFREGSFSLGGLILSCPAKGRRVDMSFDSAMTDLVGHFSELFGMQV